MDFGTIVGLAVVGLRVDWPVLLSVVLIAVLSSAVLSFVLSFVLPFPFCLLRGSLLVLSRRLPIVVGLARLSVLSFLALGVF